MPVCTRCHSITCNGCSESCQYGSCKTCGGFSCKGDCNRPLSITPPNKMLRCTVCGYEYFTFHICGGERGYERKK